MPRQIDLHRHNFKVNKDPTQTLGWNGTDLTEPPTAAEMLEQQLEHFLHWCNQIIAQIVHILTFGVIPVTDVENALDNLNNWAFNLFQPFADFAHFLDKLLNFPEQLISGIHNLVMDGVHTVQNFLDKIHDALTGQTGSSGKTVSDVADAAGNVANTANNAQGSANNANSGVALIQAQLSGVAVGGIYGTDLFAGSSSSSLGSNYNQYYSGAGAGSLGLSGGSQARWHASGLIFGRSCNAIRNDFSLNTDQQRTWLLLTDTVNHGASVILILRANANSTTVGGTYYAPGSCYVFAELTRTLIGGNDQAQFGYCLSGSTTYFGSPLTYSANPGDVYSLQIGTSSHPREYILTHNGNTLMGYVDSGTSSILGADFRHPGFGVVAAGGLLGEVGPPDIESFTWCDAA